MKTEIDLALLVVSVIFFGLIAGTSAAMQLLSYARPEKNGDDEAKNARFVDRLVDDPVNNYFSIGLGKLLVLVLVLFVSHKFAITYLFTGANQIASTVLFVLVAVLVPFTVSHLLALRAPDKFVEFARFAIYPTIYLLRPIVFVMVHGLRRISPRLLNALSFPVLTFQKRIELVGYANGHEETDEQHLVSSVFEFGDTRVREVMVPRIDMIAVNIHMNPADALTAIVDAGHSRVPVFDDSIDKIVGVIHTKDLLKKLVTEKEFSLVTLRRDVHFVPESKMIDELLSEFKKLKIHLAIVVDEYGGTAGLITLEDVLEELVGDIQDEFDTEEEMIKRIDEDTAVCSSRVRLDDVNQELGLDLPVGDVDTLGGFLYETIGRVPRVGEVLTRGAIEFKIQSVVRQRIDKILVKGLSSIENGIEGGIG
ncbi:MAG: hemolysin family protein [Candidatus Krumholzibacteria bacterium]|nr:hemolysin family protein [Candidatus Krumholzibacteria bacterium]